MLHKITTVDGQTHLVDMPASEAQNEPLRCLRSWGPLQVPAHTNWLVSTKGVYINLAHVITCDPDTRTVAQKDTRSMGQKVADAM